MKCILVKKHGSGKDFHEIIYEENNYPKPKPKKGQVLLRVQACSLAPGDVRTMSGQTKFVQSRITNTMLGSGGESELQTN